MSVVIVYETGTDNQYTYTSSPRNAVIAAYAQSQGDWQTWNYEKNYGHLVQEVNGSFRIGNFSAKKGKS